jgi:hypothetical protein
MEKFSVQLSIEVSSQLHSTRPGIRESLALGRRVALQHLVNQDISRV